MVNNLLDHLSAATLQGSLFFLAVWTACLLFRKLPAAWRCWLWRLVPVKFLLAAAVSVSIPCTIASLPSTGKVLKTTVTSPEPAPASLFAKPKLARAQPHFSSAASSPVETAPVAKPMTAFQPLSILIVLWIAGVSFFLLKGGVSLLAASRVLKNSKDSDLKHLFHTVSGNPLNLRIVEGLAAPALIGILKPAIVLPADYQTTSAKAVEAALAHELAHLKRRDAAWILLSEIVKAIFWFNPLAWIACREQRIEAEIASDHVARTWTETSPREYARHLLEWIDPRRESMIAVTAVPGLLPSTHALVRRMREMSQSRYQGAAGLAWGFLLIAPILIGLAPMKLELRDEKGLAKSPWPKIHGSSDSIGRGGATAASGVQTWTFKTQDNVESTPVIGPDGTIYVSSADHRVYAIDGATGKKRWEFLTGNTVMSTPTIASDGTVYVGSEDHNVYALDGVTGKKKWAFATDGLIYASPALGTDGTVYIGSWDRYVYALDGATGVQKWAYQTAGPVTSSAALGKDGTVYIGSQDGRLYALDPKDGNQKWVFVASETMNDPSIGPDGTIYAGSWDGNVYAIDGTTGVKKWAYLTGNSADSCPSVGPDGTVYIGSHDQRVYALDGVTGERKWAYVTDGPVYSSPAIGADGTVYIGSKDQHLYALDGTTGEKKWAFDAGDAVDSSPAIGADGTIYFGNGSGTVFALR